MHQVTLLICGGRDYEDWPRLYQILDDIHARRGVGRILHGATTGADTFAGRWARSRGVEEVACEARWDLHGNAAGPKRNAYMLTWQPDGVIAFPGGRGTENMVRQAREAGVPVKDLR